MAKKESKKEKSCFIIMPISTPENLLERYDMDKFHFRRVLESMLIPAVKEAKFKPIPPIMKGSNLIKPEIIQHLVEADLVLCDLSIWNPNVLFELGVRTALNKPACLIKDKDTKGVPFDIGDQNYHEYKGIPKFDEIDKEREKLIKHISTSYQKSDGNALWKHYSIGVSGKITEPANKLEGQLKYLTEMIEDISEQDISKQKYSWQDYQVPADELSERFLIGDISSLIHKKYNNQKLKLDCDRQNRMLHVISNDVLSSNLKKDIFSIANGYKFDVLFRDEIK